MSRGPRAASTGRPHRPPESAHHRDRAPAQTADAPASGKRDASTPPRDTRSRAQLQQKMRTPWPDYEVFCPVMVRRILLTLGLLVAIACGPSTPPALTILHFNDVYEIGP